MTAGQKTQTTPYRLLLAAGLTLVCLGGLIMGTGLVLGSSWVRQTLLSRLNAAIPGTVSMAGLDVQLLSGQVRATEILVSDPAGKTVVKARDLSAALSYRALASGRLHFTRVTLSDPQVFLLVAEDGSISLADALTPEPSADQEPPTAPSPINVMVDQLQLVNGTLNYAQPSAGIAASLPEISIIIQGFHLDRLSARINLETGAGELATPSQRHRLFPLRLTAQLDQDKLSEIALKAGLAGISLDLSGSVHDLFRQPAPDLKATGAIDLETAFGPDSPLSFQPSLNGRLSYSAALKGTLDHTLAEVNLSAPSIAFQDRQLSDLNLAIAAQTRLPENKFILDRLDLNTRGLSLTGQGVVGLSQLDLDAALSLAVPDLSLLDPATGIKGGGHIAGSILVSGRLDQPVAQVTATAGDLAVNQARADRADLSLLADTAGISLKNLALSMGEGRAAASGTLTFAAQDQPGQVALNLNAQNLALEPLVPGASGTLELDAGITGPVSDPKIRLLAGARDLALEGFHLGQMDVSGTWQGTTLTLDRAQLRNKQSRLDVKGGIRTEKGEPFVSLDTLDATLMLEDFSPQFNGRIQLSGEARGALSSIEGRVGARGERIDLMGMVLDKLTAEIRLNQGQLNLQTATAEQGGQPVITLAGGIDLLKKTLDLRADLADVVLPVTAAIKEADIHPGRVSGRVLALGTLESPSIQGHLELSDARMGSQPLPGARLDLDLKHRHLTISGNAGPDFQGSYALDTRAFDLQLSARDQDLSPYFRLAGQPDFSGRMTGMITTTGREFTAGDITARIQMDRLDIFRGDIQWLGLANATATLAEGRFDLPRTTAVLGPSGRLSFQGTGDIQGRLDLTAQGELPFELIRLAAPDLAPATGVVGLSASVSGTVSAPRIAAEITARDLGFNLPDLEQSVKEINGTIRISGQTVVVDQIRGKMGEGEIRLAGTVGLDSLEPVAADLKLDGTALPLDIPDTAELTLNTGLALTGTQGRFRLDGQIVLLDGTYYRDLRLNLMEAAAPGRKPPPDPAPALPDLIARTELNIHLTRRQPLMVENNLASLEASPDLLVRGTVAAPVVSGRAKVDAGTVTFQKAVFDIKKGVVDFTNPYRIEPLIDIEAHTEIRDWAITLTISGPPEDLRVAFASTPAEQDADILSLITLGKTTRELRSADGGGALGPGEIAAFLMSDSLEKNIKDATGLDYVRVESKEARDPGQKQGVNVSLGADLSRQISVHYGVDVQGKETVQRVTTTYKLLEQLLLNGFQDTAGTFGGELKYRLEFR